RGEAKATSDGEMTGSAIEGRIAPALANAQPPEALETLRTPPFTSIRYCRVKPRGGGSSKCPYNTTTSSCELNERYTLRYECPAFKNLLIPASSVSMTFA